MQQKHPLNQFLYLDFSKDCLFYSLDQQMDINDNEAQRKIIAEKFTKLPGKAEFLALLFAHYFSVHDAFLYIHIETNDAVATSEALWLIQNME